MSLHTINILHLSDLHERGPREDEHWRRHSVLGPAWQDNLDKLRSEGPIDLVCFTGDLADWGKAEELTAAGEWLSALLARLELSRERLFLVPGNHDIDRKLAPELWKTLRERIPRLGDDLAISRWLVRGKAPLGFQDAERDAVLGRQSAYRAFLQEFGLTALLPERSTHGRLGYRVTLCLPGRPFDVHIVGLDSAWLAGDDADAGRLLLTADQIMCHLTDDKGRPLSGLRLSLIHHPLTDLADRAASQRLLATHTDLLLRGHLHETAPELWADPDHKILHLPVGCLYEGHRGNTYVNGCQLIRIVVDENGRPLRYELRLRAFSERGFWHDASNLYQAAEQGRLRLAADGQVLKEPRYFFMPLDENPYFTGHAATLDELHRALHERHMAALTQPQALSGLGGIGKTQLAAAYAYRHRSEYDAVFWLDAPGLEALTSGFAALASRLELAGKTPDKSLAESAGLFRAWLQRNARWLLVLDNVEEPEDLRQALPRTAHGHLLITTRRSDLQGLGIVRPVVVQKLSNEEAVALLLSRTARLDANSAERAAAAALAELLGELPLALEQAAAFMVTQRMAIADYLQSYKRRDLELLERAPPQFGSYPRSVVTTWQVNFEQIQGNRAAVAALRLCALLGAAQIPLDLICAVAANFDPRLGRALKDAEKDPVLISDVLAPLLRYALLSRDADKRTVTMHRLVQEVVKAELPEAELREYARRLIDALSLSFPVPEEPRNWARCEHWLPHVLMVLEHSRRLRIEGEWAARLHNQVGLYLDGRIQHAAAEPLFKRAIELRQRIEETPQASLQNRLNLSISLSNLAGLYMDRGQPALAEKYIEQSVQVIERTEGPESPYLGAALLKRAQWLRANGRHLEATAVLARALRLVEKDSQAAAHYQAVLLLEQAENLSSLGHGKEAAELLQSLRTLCEEQGATGQDFYTHILAAHSRLQRESGQYLDAEGAARDALSQARESFGQDHPRYAETAQTLALTLIERGCFKEAIELLRSAEKIWLELFGPESRLYADTLRNLATCYRQLSEYKQAVQLAEQALRIKEQTNVDARGSLSDELNELGLIYQAQGRGEEAEQLFLRALDDAHKTLGPEHASIATLRNNLALVYEDRAAYDDAEREYQRAGELAQRLLGPEHPDYFLKLHNLAHLKLRRGHHNEAIALLTQVLQGWKKAYGEEHDKVVVCLNGLSGAAMSAGDVATADRYAQEAVRIAEKVYGPSHPGFASSLAALAENYRARELAEKALPLYERALDILSRSGQEDSMRAKVQGGLGACLNFLKRHDEAIVHLRAALELSEDWHGKDHPEHACTLSDLGSALLELHDYAGAEVHLLRALELFKNAHGERHPRYATLLSNLAFLRREQGRLDEAIGIEKSVTALREELLGTAHPRVALSYASLAALQTAQGQHQAARESLEQAAIRREAPTADAPHLRLSQLLREGETQRHLGEHERAILTLSEAEQLAIGAFGAGSWHHLEALTQLAVTHVENGRSELASSMLEQAKAIMVRLGNVPISARARYYIAAVMQLRIAGRLADAEAELKSALDRLGDEINREKPLAIQLYNLRAGISEARKDYAQADTCYRQALALIPDLVPSRERDVLEAMTFVNHVQTLAKLGQLDEAGRASVQAQQLVERAFPPHHPVRISLAQRQAWLAEQGKDFQASIRILDGALAIADKLWSKAHPVRRALHLSLAEAHAQAKRPEQAVAHAQRVLEMNGELGPIEQGPKAEAETLMKLALIHWQAHQLNAADGLSDASFELAKTSKDGWTILRIGQHRAMMLAKLGDREGAEQLLVRLLETASSRLKPEHPIFAELNEKLTRIRSLPPADSKEDVPR